MVEAVLELMEAEGAKGVPAERKRWDSYKQQKDDVIQQALLQRPPPLQQTEQPAPSMAPAEALAAEVSPRQQQQQQEVGAYDAHRVQFYLCPMLCSVLTVAHCCCEYPSPFLKAQERELPIKEHFAAVCRACSAPRLGTSTYGATQDDFEEQQGPPAGMYSQAIGPQVAAAVADSAAAQREQEAEPVAADPAADAEVSAAHASVTLCCEQLQ